MTTRTSYPPAPPPASTGDERLVVIVPCFNEEANVEATVADVLAEMPRIPMPTKVLLVDDGSTDRTREKIAALCEAHPCCLPIYHSKNEGLGRSIFDGIEWARPDDWVTIQPGDNEFVFGSVHRFLEARDRYDLILGYFQNPIVRTLPRRLASEAFVRVVRIAYGFPFRYLNGFYFFRARCFQGIHVESTGHAWGPEMLAKAILREPLLRVGERPFAARGRAIGDSKAIRPRAIARAMREFVVGFRATSEYRSELLGERATE